MKVLFFVPSKIDSFGGGSIAAQRYVRLLSNLKKDGKIDDFLIVSLDNYKNSLGLYLKKTRFLDALSRVFLKSNYSYFFFLKNRHALINYKPDCVILDNSRLGFAASFFKKYLPSCHVVTNFDNIEFDYCINAASPFMLPFERKIVFTNEKKCVNHSDHLIFLSERDRQRCYQLYESARNKNFSIFPITLSQTGNLCLQSTRPTLLITGLLSYRPNEDGIIWFSENVLPLVNRSSLDIIVAGNSPSQNLRNLCKAKGIRIVANFVRLEDFVPQKACMLAPLITGAGMKTKVAKSLSYGMYVIGTSEALVGYDEIISPDARFVKLANTPSQIAAAIDDYCYSFYHCASFEENVILFSKFYSTDSYCDMLMECIYGKR